MLMTNYFIQIYGCDIVRFSLHRCKWGASLCGEVVICGVTGCSYVESVTFVRKCDYIYIYICVCVCVCVCVYTYW